MCGGERGNDTRVHSSLAAPELHPTFQMYADVRNFPMTHHMNQGKLGRSIPAE